MNVEIAPIAESEILIIQHYFDAELNDTTLSILGFGPSLADIKRHSFNDPDFDSELFLGAYVENELAGFILGIMRPWKKGRELTGFIKSMMVFRKFRRQNIGQKLLYEVEKKLAVQGCGTLEFGSASPLYLFPGVPDDDKALQRLLNKNGWEKTSHRINLNIEIEHQYDFDKEIETILLENKEIELSVNRIQPGDDTFKFIKQEFSYSWALESVSSFSNCNSFCSVLKDSGSNEFLGFAAVNTANPNWFGPMGVRKDLRSKGFGKLLVLHAFYNAQKLGTSSLILPWVNEKEVFYKKIFKNVERYVFLKFQKEILA